MIIKITNNFYNLAKNTFSFSTSLIQSSVSFVHRSRAKKIAIAVSQIMIEDFVPAAITFFINNRLQNYIKDEQPPYVDQKFIYIFSAVLISLGYAKSIKGNLRFLVLKEAIPLLLNEQISKQSLALNNDPIYNVNKALLMGSLGTLITNFYINTLSASLSLANYGLAEFIIVISLGYQMIFKSTDNHLWPTIKNSTSILLSLSIIYYSLPNIINQVLLLTGLSNPYLDECIKQTVYVVLLSLMANFNATNNMKSMLSSFKPELDLSNFNFIFGNLFNRIHRALVTELRPVVQNYPRLKIITPITYLAFSIFVLKDKALSSSYTSLIVKANYYVPNEELCEAEIVKNARMFAQAQRSKASISKLPTALLTKIGIFCRNPVIHSEERASDIFLAHFPH